MNQHRGIGHCMRPQSLRKDASVIACGDNIHRMRQAYESYWAFGWMGARFRSFWVIVSSLTIYVESHFEGHFGHTHESVVGRSKT
jgi:hypothetical protein